jgi:hypothetical protein
LNQRNEIANGTYAFCFGGLNCDAEVVFDTHHDFNSVKSHDSVG